MTWRVGVAVEGTAIKRKLIRKTFDELTQRQPQNLLRYHVAQTERVELRVGLGTAGARHRPDEVVHDAPDVGRLVDANLWKPKLKKKKRRKSTTTNHAEPMIRQMDVKLLLVLQTAEIPRWAEVRREASVDSQLIHVVVFPRANPTLKCDVQL